jgi:hypothetical protein
MNINVKTDLIEINETQYIGKDKNNSPVYYTKVQCAECGCNIYRRTFDLKNTINSYCSVKCKKEHREKNGFNKIYTMGKVYSTNKQGIVKTWTGRSWSYRKRFTCKNCDKEILREYKSNRCGKEHFCDNECWYRFYHPKESKILEQKDTINFCYLVGLIATDGCVIYPSKNYLTGSYSTTICLNAKDSDILYKIQKEFGGDFTYYEKENVISNEITSNMARWAIHYKKFVLYLKSIGVTRNKSLTLNINKYFKKLTYEQQKACIRGMIDGDGSICINKENRLVVSFVSGSYKFCKMAFDFINDITNTNNQIYKTKINDSNAINYSFNFTGDRAVEICDELFKDFDEEKDLYLKRKYENYIKIKQPDTIDKREDIKYNPSKTYPVINERSIRFQDDLTYDYTLDQQKKELINIHKKRGTFEASTSPYNKIVLSHQPHYYETEKRLWKENKNGLRDRLLANRLKYIYKNEYQINEKEILRGFKISGEYIGFSHFNPLWIKGFIEKYNITSIYDPTMGWGHRLLGARDIKYIGNDWDVRTYNGCKQICIDFDLKDKFLYNNDCSVFTPVEDYEAVFTCPPYFNTEIYDAKEFNDLSDYKDWWDKTIKCCLKPTTKYFAFVINHEYKDILNQVCTYNNLILLEEHALGRQLNHFQVNADVVKGEFLCVFIKKMIQANDK